MRLMLRDAMLRLRNNGFTILSLAMRVKYPELVTLANMTVFALMTCRSSLDRMGILIVCPDLMKNLKIAVHSVYLPFPRIHPTSAAPYDEITGGGGGGYNVVAAAEAAEDGACSMVYEEDGSNCWMVPPMPAQVKPSVAVQIDEDHHGL
ncbi:hypothetical protein OIU74_005323 [Salix koriyanagi]|uniref:Uncharacterized protein n=1 Tax=Salix koriyanagi TaxID=2511006 RepID=A0A9Q0UNN1_9ROSI|nr:hypothetical protein OIU74_005323 [Salix koriyanagi]